MKRTHKYLSILLALALLLGMVPMTAMAAGEKTEVTQIETRISAEYVPYAGRDYTDLYTYIDSSIYGRAQNTGSDWVDDAGVTIEEKGNGDYGEWYNIRYQFEAGRTYTAEYSYMINPSYEETYKFTENTTVTLTNPDPSKCTITGEVIKVRDSGRICDVRYTMTIAGERSYPDIKAVTLQKIATPADGVQVETTALMYSNCTLTSQAWSPNVSTFAAGNTYTLTVNLHAKDGYKFADDFAPVMGIKGYEKAADSVQLLNSKKDAAVSFTYSVGNYTFIDTLELEPISDAVNFFPVAGESARYFPDLFEPADSAPYEKEWLSSRQWYNEDDKTYMEQGDVFEAGKTYSYHSIFRIKTENEGTHRFASPTVQLGNFIYKNDVQTEVGDDPLRISVTFTYTCKFPAGAGSSMGNPAVCNSYGEFKYAMESNDIRYVALGDVEDIITKVEGDGLIPAISVNGIKNLNVIGNATFTAPASGDGYKTVCALLHCEQGSTLNLSGAGKLTFKAVTNASYNAVVWNQGGSVYVDGATLIGSYNTAVYGKAIWQSYGELRISDGQFFAENALEPGKLPAAHTAVYIDGGQAWIQGGTFKTENKIDTFDLPYGLDIGQYATVDLSGGTYYGILLPTSSTPLANYMDEELYTPLSDESWFNPESEYSQGYVESGKVVRIVWLIDHVDVHINAPIAGVEITENYFNVPTSGCQAAMYYPMWYKNGEIVPYGTFEAGASYKVVVQIETKPGYNAEFTNGVTAAINNKAVTVDRKSANWLEVEYDFGECPNVLPTIELTVTAPKEHNTPNYMVGCASDAYSAAGGAGSRRWMESANGEGNWREMESTDEFKAGYYYKFYADIKTAKGYEFPVIDTGRIEPDVFATVNGYYAKVIKAYDQDPSTYITVEYNFGMCNDDTVEQIAVVDVTAPVAGEKPNYTYNILGNGYKMNTAKNAYYDDWMHDQKLYYIKNGIGWWDVTEEDWVYEHETFIPGHEYEVNVYLITEDGYEFAYTPKNYENATTATVNGKTAEVEISGGYWSSQRQVEYTFDCQKKSVSSVLLYDLDAPQDGKNPDTAITTAYPELYTVEKVTWFDCEGTPILPTDTFEQGVPYKVEVKIVPTQYGGVNACTFINENFKIYLDGNEVGNYYTDEVYVSSNAVYLYYTFRKGASAPEGPSGTAVSGSAVSWNDTDDAVYLLYSSSTADSTIKAEWAAGSYNALYTATKGSITDATVDNKAMKSQTFTFEEVADGTYKLVILKPGKYVPKIVEITVGGSPVSAGQQKLWLYGDVNYDGSVNNLDILQINRNISSLDSIFDAGTDEDKESRNVAANVTALISGDTEVNNLDVLQINRYISSLDSIFDTMK